MTNSFYSKMDAAHINFPLFDHPFVRYIWETKYRWGDERTPNDTFARVANAVTDGSTATKVYYDAMSAGLWMPGGRIIAGAGTSKRVTLFNCYVNQTLEDDLQSIMQGVNVAALTQQQGGGIGTDFSTLRPEGAILKRTGGRASGPLPFMDMWHAMCSTIMSAGDRRGAMMGTISDTHPDLPKYIVAKQEKDRLTNFNISVLVSDTFMEAVKEDVEWHLYFPVPPKEPNNFGSFDDESGVRQYIYSEWRACDLWAMITKNTYEYSEPGVIFIDRINDLNNLKHCETIHCTNPCGEQPLPPHGCCNLGAANLARMVHKPFKSDASFNFDLLREVATLGVNFLDSVIDINNYPLPEQQEEQTNKRRLGLGVSGLADCLAQLGLRYGAPDAVEMTDKIFYNLCQAAYAQSCERARMLGTYPMWEADVMEASSGTFASERLDYATRERIAQYGLRNGLILTVAPTGTTSILFGNISSGIEPVFDHAPRRRVRQPDNTYKEFETLGYGLALYNSVATGKPQPSSMVTTDDLSIEDHILTQAAAQRWIDASVSKTINVSKDTTYDQFVRVYDLAYATGCKGCTTYRPSLTRGAILIKADQQAQTESIPRPTVLCGVTHKLRWPSMAAALYVTVNYTEDGKPFELFLSSKDGQHHDWMTATSLMISAILRKGGDVSFIAEELIQVRSFGDYARLTGPRDEHPRHYGSLPAYIGAVLGEYLKAPKTSALQGQALVTKGFCSKCQTYNLESKEGCKTCTNCGYSNCE